MKIGDRILYVGAPSVTLGVNRIYVLVDKRQRGEGALLYGVSAWGTVVWAPAACFERITKE